MAYYKYFLNGDNGELYVYENKVVIERKRFRAILALGFSGAKTIPMDSIMSVQFKEPSFFSGVGFIQFGILGGVESHGGTIAAKCDENSVTFRAANTDNARNIKDYIEGIIFNRGKNNGTVVQQTSPAEELKKFKELLDIGVITQDEFDAKKKEILGI